MWLAHLRKRRGPGPRVHDQLQVVGLVRAIRICAVRISHGAGLACGLPRGEGQVPADPVSLPPGAGGYRRDPAAQGRPCHGQVNG